MHLFNRLNASEKMLVIGLLIFSFIPTFGGLFRIVDLSIGMEIMPLNPRAIDSPLPIVIHILSSFVFCLAGIQQFLPAVRRWKPVAHRIVGHWVFWSGVISAISGLWMTMVFSFPEELQGQPLYLTRLLVGASMLVFLIRGMYRAKSAQFQSHRTDMLKAYALGQGASTQTFLGISWMILVGADAEGFNRDVLMIGAWLLNFLVAEVISRRSLALPESHRVRRPMRLQH